MLIRLKEIILNSKRGTKQAIAASVDLVIFGFCLVIAISLDKGQIFSPDLTTIQNLFWFPFIGIIILSLSGAYRSIVRFINFFAIFILVRGLLILILLDLLILLFFQDIHPYKSFFTDNSFIQAWLILWLLILILVVGVRMLANAFLSEQIAESRVIIYGAGSAGIQLAVALRHSSEMQPICFIDRNPSLQDTLLSGLKVFSPNKLKKIVIKKNIDEVLIAIPSASKSNLQSLLKEIEQYSVKVRILPGVAELAQGKISVSELKEVDISDLLGRSEVVADYDLINKNINDKVVMVTGAGGSIGSEIARQVLNNNPKKLVILDSNEFSLYSLRQELKENNSSLCIESVLTSVNNKSRLIEICNAFKVETIYHSAAYKHVPLVEENPFEGVLNNIFGTLNCVEAAKECSVETFVLISTDKAVRPTNIMGATKRFSELILQSLSNERNLTGDIKITMVRFGNVLGSSGSAIPLFKEQIKNGGPITVTHPDVIRYFMTIPEAAQLVIQAGAMGEGGEVFVLDMGKPVKVVELAKRLVRLSGMEVKNEYNPDGDIEIVFTGLRPGEKLYEELLIGDNVIKTQHKQIFKANEDFISWSKIEEYLKQVQIAESTLDYEKLIQIFKETVSGYDPKDPILDIAYTQKKDP